MGKWLVALLLAAVTSGSALGQGADVAVVNMVSGDVTYVPQAGPPGKVQPYMKIREGDRVNVPANGHIRVVFFAESREERWVGPASFRVTKTAAEPISGKVAEVVSLPAGVSQKIARVPALIQYAKLGGTQVRGLTRQQQASLNQQATLAQARTDYEKLRKDMPADDITPELYLYAVLYEYLVYDEMKSVVEEMRRKQPDNEDIKALNAWVTSKMSR